jgi:hypothetical protein
LYEVRHTQATGRTGFESCYEAALARKDLSAHGWLLD